AGAFLGKTEAQVLQIVADAPADIRHAISSLLDELRHGHVGGNSPGAMADHAAIIERRDHRKDGK
ncbi:MAG TPA: hypothetical protein VL996_12145, partial [Methylocella sp.]|nr:hypothetical protein [Methylocella sp.]